MKCCSDPVCGWVPDRQWSRSFGDPWPTPGHGSSEGLPCITFWVTYHIVAPSECTGGGITRVSQACSFLNTELQVHDQGVFIQDIDLHKSKSWICNRHVFEIHGAGMILSAQWENVDRITYSLEKLCFILASMWWHALTLKPVEKSHATLTAVEPQAECGRHPSNLSVQKAEAASSKLRPT